MAPAMLADSREPELVIVGTAQDGLLVFNGRAFRQILPQDPTVRTVTSLLPTASGHILMGTRKRGVLLYDGKKITLLHPTVSSLYVTTLAGTESDLWVGTLNQGVLHWHAGETDSFGEEQGLPDRQVQSIAVSGNTTFVGTVLGATFATRGLVLAYHDRAVAAMFTRSCGGRTPTPQEVGLSSHGYPYLSAVCDYCLRHPSHWIRRVSSAEAADLRERGEASRLDMDRRLGWSAVPSNNFIAHSDENGVVLEGTGEGHGIGLCQEGRKPWRSPVPGSARFSIITIRNTTLANLSTK